MDELNKQMDKSTKPLVVFGGKKWSIVTDLYLSVPVTAGGYATIKMIIAEDIALAMLPIIKELGQLSFVSCYSI